MGHKRVRLLDLLQTRFPEISKKELHARAVCGEVFVGGERVRDPGTPVDPQAELSLTRAPYVSRGGEKLEHALMSWNLPVRGKIFLDAGSSTGGFTDCLLQHGAEGVHAVDVGYNQIDFSLRTDSRVFLHERTNLMELTSLNPAPEAATADLSFRSIVGAAVKLLELTREEWAVVLIKPQFEYAAGAGAGNTGAPGDFAGVIESPKRLAEVLRETVSRLDNRGIPVLRLLESPIRGRKGNREFLALIGREPAGALGEVPRPPGTDTPSSHYSGSPAEVIDGIRRESDRGKDR